LIRLNFTTFARRKSAPAWVRTRGQRFKNSPTNLPEHQPEKMVGLDKLELLLARLIGAKCELEAASVELGGKVRKQVRKFFPESRISAHIVHAGSADFYTIMQGLKPLISNDLEPKNKKARLSSRKTGPS
jgi:hypothetical protein